MKNFSLKIQSKFFDRKKFFPRKKKIKIEKFPQLAIGLPYQYYGGILIILNLLQFKQTRIFSSRLNQIFSRKKLAKIFCFSSTVVEAQKPEGDKTVLELSLFVL